MVNKKNTVKNGICGLGGETLKKYIIVVSVILVILLVSSSLKGLHLSEVKAIPGNVKVVRTLEINGIGKAVLYEEKSDQSFGVAELERKFGFLYHYDGGTSGYWTEKGKPFQAVGVGENKYFIVAVKTADDSNIKYIAIGNHMEGITPTETYELTLDDVYANRDDYNLKEVTDNYALFVLDDYTEDTWTIRAFDQNGILIADKIYGGDERYVDW